MDLFAESAPPAGGAAFDEILIALGIFTVVYLPLGWFLMRERGGHVTLLGRVADAVSSRTGLPRWAGLPRANLHSRSGLALLAGPRIGARGDRGELSPCALAPLFRALATGEPAEQGLDAPRAFELR